jgi:hypothetical protein
MHSHVVVATGRFNKPALPDIAGIGSFSGYRGVTHTFDYHGTDSYRDGNVLVLGCSVSALEIASDIAASGSGRVVCANRRQRYIMPKIAAGVPIDYHMHTRVAALANETLSKHTIAAELKLFFERTCGLPQQYGAPTPPDDVLMVGITQCQQYLPLVAEGRIEIKPWVTRIDGRSVRFSDGTTEEFDGIIVGTGFQLDLPFLSDELRQQLCTTPWKLDLYKATFHPRMPGLAFAGLFQVGGPYFPPIEVQARWIAYVWGGVRPSPSLAEMEAGIAEAKSVTTDKYNMPLLTVRFAREAGVEPRLWRWPLLCQSLLLGPLLPAVFRLDGADCLADGAKQVLETASALRHTAQLDLQVAWLDALQAVERPGAEASYLQEALAAMRTVADLEDQLGKSEGAWPLGLLESS